MFSIYQGIFKPMLLLLLLLALVSADQPCAYQNGACVCNSTYCDTVQPIGSIPASSYVLVESNDQGARFAKSVGQISPFNASQAKEGSVVISLNTSSLFQEIIGFGGAFTDAATVWRHLLTVC